MAHHKLDQIWKPHVVVAAIAERDGRFLMIEETIRGEVVFNQPAGHLDPDETLLEAVQRECMEETAHAFAPRSLVGVYQWITPEGRQFLRFTFAGEAGTHYPERALDDGIIAAHWLTLDDIRTRTLRSPVVVKCLEDYLKGERHDLSLIQSWIVR
jgi:8-oxo-dGTP pyrophosphatase MutT (NUDIX family)